MQSVSVPGTTPVIVGVGQHVDRLDDPNYARLSAVEIAAAAGQAALADSAVSLAEVIDVVATTRTFNDSAPHFRLPFGASNNFPRSIAMRLGIEAEQYIWEDSGGNTPQNLVSEMCERLADGRCEGVLIAGAEAISTARRLIKEQASVDWSETLDDPVEDRHGQQTKGILTGHAYRHGLLAAPTLYGLSENARRHRAGENRESWRSVMADWFAPFAAVAADNPFSSTDVPAYSKAQIAEVTSDNRLIADPYPRLLVARDQVNQGAALVLTTVAKATELGIDASNWVFLHGYAAAKEKIIEHRPHLDRYPAAVAAARAALEYADATIQDIAAFDFYSCFPIAVTSVAEAFDLTADDPRKLTVTGGLPYFGGPGNNYSMHGIASMVEWLRAHPEQLGFVGANGGFLSKYAVGIYSTKPRAFSVCDSAALQQDLDAIPDQPFTEEPDGTGVIETYTIEYARDGAPKLAIIVGRLEGSDLRFIANTDDESTLKHLVEVEPIGLSVVVAHKDRLNHFSLA